MPRTKQELKAAACAAIDRNREKIIALGDSIYHEAEMGYKEFKTAAKIAALFDELGYAHQDGVAITGVIAPRPGRDHKVRLAIMGEMDALVIPSHPDAVPETGAAHCCGHNCMIAGLAGVAIALKEADIMPELDGDIVLMAVPAEEYVEIEYRNQLRQEGKIHFLGGKPEFIRLGAMDDIDMMIMQHTSGSNGDKLADCGGASNGFAGKLVQYIGKEAHAGGAPYDGINALNAAQIGLMAVNAQRETFRDQDHIRVHPIITKGGDLVNVVPADVRIETYVRGATVEAILDASKKVNRAFEAGAYALGAECRITELPGYMPVLESAELKDVMYDNLCQLLGAAHVVKDDDGVGGGSTDAGDVSQIMPVIQASIGGAEGAFHSPNFRLVNRDLAYITAAKALVMTAIDLLADGAEVGLEAKKNYKAPLTKDEYLRQWGGIEG